MKAAGERKAAADVGGAKRSESPRLTHHPFARLQAVVGNRALLDALADPPSEPQLLSNPESEPEKETERIVERVFGMRTSNSDGRPQGAVSPELSELIAAARGRGTILPLGLRRSMECELGGRYDAVRIHHDDLAARAAAALGARAFTSGQDIFFARDAWRPELASGRALLAHELVHASRHDPTTIYRATELQKTRLRQELWPSTARHRAVVSIGMRSSGSDPFDTLGIGGTQVDAIKDSYGKLPAVWRKAAKGAAATLTFAVSDTLTRDSQTWLESLASTESWRVEVLVPRVRGLQGWAALSAAQADNELAKKLELAVEKTFEATAATKSPAKKKTRASPAAGATKGAAVGRHAKTTRRFELRATTDAKVAHDQVPKGLWVYIDEAIDGGEAFYIVVRSTGQRGVAHRSWVAVKEGVDAQTMDQEDEARLAEMLRDAESLAESKTTRPTHPWEGRFAKTTKAFPLRTGVEKDADVIDHVPKNTWVKITGAVDPAGEAFWIYVPSTGRPGVASRSWFEVGSDDQAAKEDEDVLRMLEPEEEPEEPAKEKPAPELADTEGAEVLQGVDVDAVIDAEIELYALDIEKLRRMRTLLVKKSKPGGPPRFHGLSDDESTELSALEDWTRQTGVAQIAARYEKAFEDATRQIGRNVIGALEAKVLQAKAKLPQTVAALGRSSALKDAREAAQAWFASWREESKHPSNAAPGVIALPPAAQKHLRERPQREARRKELSDEAQTKVRSLAKMYPFVGEEFDATQPFDWKRLAATQTEEHVAIVLTKDIEDRLESIKRAKEFLEKKDAIYELDKLLAQAREVFGVEENSVPAAVLKVPVQRVATGKQMKMLFELAINFIPGGIWIKAGRLVVGVAMAAQAYKEHYDLTAAQDVGLVSDDPHAIWLLLHLASVGIDAGRFVKAAGALWPKTLKALASMDPAGVRALQKSYSEMKELRAEYQHLKRLLDDDIAYKEALALFHATRRGSAAVGLPYIGGAVNEFAHVAYLAAKRGTWNFRKWLVELKVTKNMAAASKLGGKNLRAAWRRGKARARAELNAAKAKVRRNIGDRKADALKALPPKPARPAGGILDDAIAKKGDWTEGDKALVGRWSAAMDTLAKSRGKAAVQTLADDLLKPLGANYGDSAYRLYVRTLRQNILDDIFKTPAGIERTAAARAAQLRKYLRGDVLPDSATKGAIFTAFRQKTLGTASLSYMKPISGLHPRAPQVKRAADGALEVTTELKGGPPKGTYAVEDKAGTSFNSAQAEDYDEALRAGWSLKKPVGAASKKKIDGVIYFFEDETTAKNALKTINTLRSNIRVAVYKPDGAIEWLR